MGTGAQRITFGDDGSEGADRAWAWLTAQSWPGWSVDVVTVTTPPPRMESLFMFDPLREYQPEAPRAVPPSCRLRDVRYLTTAADPREILGELTDTDLLVVGGSARPRPMHVGSTAEWLLRCPRNPVLIARDGAPVRDVLVCVDGSAHAQAVVQALAGMPWLASTSVTVLSVIGTGDASIGDAAHRAADMLAEGGATVQVSLIEEDPAAGRKAPRDEILAAIDAAAPDLVALGTRGRTGLGWVLVGSVAGAVVHHITCSVLLAHASDAGR